tara:strand:+ start:9524 stop:10726 length:1203 start_codon:yes stop_codon:yes gene_type:complete
MKYILGVLIILFATYSDIFLYRINIVPVTPTEFLIPLFIVLFVLKYPIKTIFENLKSHSFKFFVCVLLLSIIFSAVSKANSESVSTSIGLDIITIILYVFTLHYFRTEDKKTVLLVMVTSFFVLAGSVWYDFLIGLPTDNLILAQSVRKGGFGENPNQAASGMKFLALGVLAFLVNVKTKRFVFIGIMFFSVFITFSRSGIITAVLILIFGTMNNWSSTFQINMEKLIKSFFRMIVLFVLLYFALLLVAGVIKENFPAFTRGAAGERIDLLLGQSDKSVIAEDTGSKGGRGDLFLKYLNDFMDNPFGYGTAYSDDKKFNSLNTHNHYLYMAINYGIVGLFIYLVFIFYGINFSFKMNRFYPFMFYSLFIFEGFIAHNVFTERSILISLAFFDSLIYRKLD